MSPRSTRFTLIVLVLLHVAVASAAQPHYESLRIIAPAAPGGGWDQTGRAMQQVLQRIGVAQVAPVENIPGAAGTIGLARFISAERGRSDVLMLSGLIMLAATITHRSPVTLRDATPVARLIGEYEVIVVPADSPLRTLSDLVAAFRKRPGAIAWGGGSAGGTDHILAGLVADAVGVAPGRVNYIAFSGGGEMLSSLLGGQLSLGVNGFAEMQPQIAAGTLRPLAISSPDRLDGIDIPTLREQGVNVELVNWRSILAAPGINASDHQRMVEAIETMVRSAEWRGVLERYHWDDRFLTGPAFDAFLEQEEARVKAILTKFGAAERPTASVAAAMGYPALVLVGLCVTGVGAIAPLLLARSTAKRRARSQHWQRVLLVGAGMVLDVLLLERIGFVLASTAMFWLAARGFDTRRPVRDAAFGVAISLFSYLLFVRLLKLSLPAGLLSGWL